MGSLAPEPPRKLELRLSAGKGLEVEQPLSLRPSTEERPSAWWGSPGLEAPTLDSTSAHWVHMATNDNQTYWPLNHYQKILFIRPSLRVIAPSILYNYLY